MPALLVSSRRREESARADEGLPKGDERHFDKHSSGGALPLDRHANPWRFKELSIISTFD